MFLDELFLDNVTPEINLHVEKSLILETLILELNSKLNRRQKSYCFRIQTVINYIIMMKNNPNFSQSKSVCEDS